VVRVTAPWGETVANAALLDALDRHPETRLVAVVHAETSTGALHPLRELGTALFGYDVLLMADCVTSLGGVPLEVGPWGVDYAYSCTQKCLAAPPGMAPVAISPRAWRRIRSRTAPVPFTLDLELLRRYWVDRPAAYHHTSPILSVYALHEALRLVLDEGLEARWARHAAAGSHLQAALRGRGLELIADPKRQLAPLTAVRVPEGVDGKAVQVGLLADHGIEVGGGLGPAAPPMWRIGLMGRNATVATATHVLTALDEALDAAPALAA
jgi:alanine-glyoxylate transaminase/serine-glyoxylate transaminase/serine-pyruvate transaminase